MGVPRYCRFCGASLSETANFCASCGQQVRTVSASRAPPPPAAPPAPPQPAQPIPQVAAPNPETIHMILPGANRHSGFLGIKVESFMIICTNRRIVFALQTVQMMQENVRLGRQEAENQGKNFFGKWGAQLSANSGKKYWKMLPDQILAEQPANFAIECEQLHSIRMRQEYTNDDSPDSYVMEFATSAGKQKFKFGHLNTRELKKNFQELYGNIVR